MGTFIVVCGLAGVMLLVWGIAEEAHPYYSMEARMRRASKKWTRRQRKVTEDFKNDIRKITRR